MKLYTVKGFTVIEMWGCEWWKLYKKTNIVKQHIPEVFFYFCSPANTTRDKERTFIWLCLVRY